MKSTIFSFITNKNSHKFKDVDFHDFVKMNEMGLSTEEISNELGVPKSYVTKLSDDLRKNY
ncbi:hypothetical protein [Dethiothermospora halolimnae]|uniref:hypothetical protein n=1 Tax=Dethiothermospora halolimnae TaxID=3114390 RepID=UPI003CCBB234